MKLKLFAMLALLSLSTVPVSANTGPGKGPKPKFYTGKIRVVNQCDEAVSCQISTGSPVVLEPMQSVEQPVYFGTNNQSTNVTVTASLVSDSSISTQSSVTVKANKTTTATITCIVSDTSVELQITSGGVSKGNSKN